MKPIHKIKSRQLFISIPLIVTGILMLLLSAVSNILLLVVGFPLLALGFIYFRRFQHLEKLSNLSINIQSLIKSIEQKKQKANELSHDLDELKEKTRFPSSEEIQNKITDIMSALKLETNLESFDALNAILENNEKQKTQLTTQINDIEKSIASLKSRLEAISSEIEVPSNLDQGIEEYEEMSKKKVELNTKLSKVEIDIQRIEEMNPQSALEKLDEQIIQINNELEILEKTKPENIETLQYSEITHEQVKKDLKRTREDYARLNEELAKKNQALEDVEKMIERLKPSYDLYPTLQKNIYELKGRIQLLELVISEMKETSKDLRNKVIPNARFIINQILPTLTDERYSDLEITEDLKFKVHSKEAGGYKEREIFSGGTQDQFLIALRLAFTQSILDSRVMADKYCLLMDECISSSDDTRKQGIFEVLDAMRKTFSQIFVIAHDDISNYVDHYMLLARNEHGYSEVKSRSWENV